MLYLKNQGLETDLLDKMQNLIKIIWSAVPIAILFVISSGINNQVSLNLTSLLIPTCFIVSGALFISIFFALLLRTKKYLELQVFLTHLGFVFICLVGIHYSGGIESPLYVIILIFFLLASVVIPSHMAISLSTIAAVLYIIMIVGEYHLWITHINFLHSATGSPISLRGSDQALLTTVRISLFYLVALVPGYLAGVLREKNLKLELANEQLKETQKQMIQSEKLASVGRLVSGITHDIRNPLTSILGFAELGHHRLADPKREFNREEFIEFLEKIIHATKHCSSVVQSLLDFARYSESDGSKENFKETSINQTIEEVLEIIEHQIYLQNIKVVRKLNTKLPTINANDSQIRQVFMNLIVNAKDAMPNGGKLTIETQVKADNPEELEIIFTDTGCGILQEKIDKIFDPFFTTKEKGKGTGLGLSVSYGIIKDHEGQVTVESKEQEGTTFKVTLPIKK